MKIKNINITIKKELRSMFRDKRTFFILLVYPVIIPLMIFFYAYMSNMEEKKYDIGIDYQLNDIEVTILKELNLEVHSYKNKEQMSIDYENHNISGYIDYDIEEGIYYIYANTSNTSGIYVSSYMQSYLSQYNDILAKSYINQIGLDVNSIFNQIEYKTIDLKSDGPSFMLSLIYTISFTYIIMAIVMTSINMATSTTATEKENGTLETILTFPITSSELIVGKYIATVIMGLMSSLVGLILTIASLGMVPKIIHSFVITYNISVSTILASIAVIFGASLFISGLAIALTCFAKTYKEAQSKSQLLTTITLIPMFISFMEINITNSFYLIPIANYIQILMDIFAGKIDNSNLITVIGSSCLYVIAIIYYIIKQYKSEKVLFTN